MLGVQERRRRLNPEDRRKLLLDDAIVIFSLRGIGRAGHTEIAQRSNVSVATVFNYFNTREALVSAVLDEVESFLLELTNTPYQPDLTALEALDYYIERFLEACRQKPDHIKIWIEWSSSIREDTWPRYIEFQNTLLEHISEAISRGIDSGHLAEGISAEERARWVIGNAHMLASLLFAPNAKPIEMKSMISRGLRHILRFND